MVWMPNVDITGCKGFHAVFCLPLLVLIALMTAVYIMHLTWHVRGHDTAHENKR